MPEYVCNINSTTKNLFSSFFDLDKAFDYIIDQLIIEGGIEKNNASSLMNNVMKVYIDKGKPCNFTVWEVEDDDGSIVKMYINEIL